MSDQIALPLLGDGDGAKHCWMKLACCAWLRGQQYYAVAPEVPVSGGRGGDAWHTVAVDSWNELATKNRYKRQRIYGSPVVDVMALASRHHAKGRPRKPALYEPTGNELVSVVVEVKASRGDFHSGWIARAAHFNYVLTPENLVQADEVPDDCGLIWFDPEARAPLNKRCWWTHSGWPHIIQRAPEQQAPVITAQAAAYGIATSLTGRFTRSALMGFDDPFADTTEVE